MEERVIYEVLRIIDGKPIFLEEHVKRMENSFMIVGEEFPLKYEDIYSVIGEPKEEIEKIKELNNYIFWSFNLKNYRKSNWWVKTASTDIKDKITIRTSNTVKKLIEISKK